MPRPGGSRPHARFGARTVVLGASALLVLAACSDSGGDADSYPDTEIEMVVPFTAGGPTDVVTRLIAEPMSDELGVRVVVDNVEGAGGTLGVGQVADSAADGYTLLLHHIGMSTAPALYDNLSFDPVESFEPLGLVTEVPMTIVANNDFEPETLEEFVSHVQENPDDVLMAHAGVGSASNLCGMLLMDALGVEIQEVPYDGTAPAMTAVQGGEVNFLCDQTTNTTEPILGDLVKAYAVTTPDRVESLPDLPTTAEAGLPEIEVSVWHGMYAPAGTDEAILELLTEALQVALEDETVIEQMADLGTTPVDQDQATPDAHAEYLTEQLDLWSEIIGDQQGG